MADGFLGRWSRRKLDVEAGKEVGAQPPVIAKPDPAVSPVVSAHAGTQGALDSRRPGNDSQQQPPAPTMEDVAALTPESDFSAFTARGIDPQVSNAAMKKLFADPHYNIMDRMDVYIDDYSKPDPIPAAWLRQMVAGKFLKLFEEDDEDTKNRVEGESPESPAVADGGDDAHTPVPQDVAQSGLCNELPSQPEGALPAASRTEHADPDLRLQQDNAPPGKDPGAGTQ